MPASRSRRLALFALIALAGGLPGGPALAAKSRIVLPETDAKATPGAPRTATVTTPVMDAMREISPGVYEGIVPVRMADGSWHVDLDERFMLFSVAQRLPGGGLARGCVHGPAGVAAWRTSVPARAAVRPQVSAPAGVVETKWEVR